MATDTTTVNLTQAQLAELIEMKQNIDKGLVTLTRENKQTIDGWSVSVDDVKEKLNPDTGKSDGVSGGLVSIAGRGCNGKKLACRGSENIELILHIIKNADQYLMFLLQPHNQYRSCGQTKDKHMMGDPLVSVEMLVRENFITQAKVDEIMAKINK